jgi:hypothetical protein
LIQAGHLTLHLLAEDAHPVRSTIADLSREQIEDLLAKYPSLHLDGGGQKLTPPEARLQLRSKVRWFARLHTAFEVDQPEAIRVIQMDPVPTDEQVIDYLNEGQG